MRPLAVALSLLLCCAAPAEAQTRTEYRAFWLDTFNTPLNDHKDVMDVVNNAKAAKANAIFAQVRRRGDAWYVDPLEPRPDFTPIAPGFDPLQDLVTEAHANNIEVHAFVIVGAVWNKNPTFAPTATLGLPTNPNHVFNLHGGYDPVTKTVIPGPNNWLTRTQLDDGGFISFQGHRFGNDFWIDLGHPAAAEYTLNVLLRLAANYQVDGVHLDRIRYPEFDAAGQTPLNGTNIGYNQTSVERFQQRHSRGASVPLTGDPVWMQWRRDQVTSFVRRLYLEVAAIKPQMKMSGAFIAFGGIGTSEASWNSAEAYWRVYQDWRAWTEEGIIDIAMPMNYKREHTALQATQFSQWSKWLAAHRYNRMGVLGLGAFVNSIEGTLPQTRASLKDGNDGVVFFSMAASNVAVSANPLSKPVAGQNTPARPFAEFASGLTTGKSVNGLTSYEDTSVNPEAIFAAPAAVPPMPWKTATTAGHLKGFALRGDGTSLDTADVTISRVDTAGQLVAPPVRRTITDGQGFFGGVDLPTGRYHVNVDLKGESLQACYASVLGAAVVTRNAEVDTVLPQIAPTPDSTVEAGPGCKAIVNLEKPAATDNCPGVKLSWMRAGVAEANPSLAFELARGQETTITWTATDATNRVTTSTQQVKAVDTTAPVVSDVIADKTVLWPADHKMVTVDLAYTVSDACATSINVSVVSDEVDPDGEADFEVVHDRQVRLRAERWGNGDGRTYTITVRAKDSSGNVTTSSTKVTVPYDQGKTAPPGRRRRAT